MRPVHPMETTLIFEHDAMLARIAELEARVRRCHAILQDIVSVSDPSVYGEAIVGLLHGPKCLDCGDAALIEALPALKARIAELEAEIARWEDRTNP